MAIAKNSLKSSGRIALRITVFDGPPDSAENFRKSFASPQRAAHYLRKGLIPLSAVPFLIPVEKQGAGNSGDLEKVLGIVTVDAPECARDARTVMRICQDLAEIEKFHDGKKCGAGLSSILARWNRRFGNGDAGVRIEKAEKGPAVR